MYHSCILVDLSRRNPRIRCKTVKRPVAAVDDDRSVACAGSNDRTRSGCRESDAAGSLGFFAAIARGFGRQNCRHGAPPVSRAEVHRAPKGLVDGSTLHGTSIHWA